jgi:DNA adenine methylase
MKPFLKWAGGKRWLTQRFKTDANLEFKRYIEPFLGSAAVYFHVLPKQALLSDQNEDLINAYNSIKQDWCGVWSTLVDHQSQHSKEYYYQVRETIFDSPVARAARLIYLNRTCFNGLYRENKFGNFNVPIGTKSSVLLPDDDFESISKVLSDTDIICEDFGSVIARAQKGDLLFVDPPYTVKHNNNGFIRYNEKIFSWNDQVRLSDVIKCAGSRGVNVIMTNALHDSVLELYRDFSEITSLERTSVLSGLPAYRNKTHEALITIGVDVQQIINMPVSKDAQMPRLPNLCA